MTNHYVELFQNKLWTSIKRNNYDGFLIQSLSVIVCILPYIFSSIGMTFFQNGFMKEFHFPFIVVSCHLTFKFLMAALIRYLYREYTGKARPVLSPDVYVKRMSAVGIVSALDIGLSNWSYEFISVLLYTMTKSSSIIFILGFSIMFGLERARPSLAAVIFFIASGLFMLTYKSTSFDMIGFLMVLAASLLGGIRWTLAQLLMQKNEYGLSNPVDMMYYIQPWMLVGLVPLAFWFEVLPGYEAGVLGEFNGDNLLRILFGCGLAFLIELSEYFLIVRTSSLTLCIAGIFKELITVALAVFVKQEPISIINTIGMVICMLGIILHVVLKIKETKCPDKDNDLHLLVRVNQRIN